MNVSQILINLMALDQLPVIKTCGLHVPNSVAIANRHGRILATQDLEEPLQIPRGAYKAVMGPLVIHA